MHFKISQRLERLPPYLFAEIDRVKRRLRAEGRDLIDLGVGDPDAPTPEHIIEALERAARDPENHRYALDAGMPALREAIAGWYLRRFGVRLDPAAEVLPLIGSKEGIGHFPLAFVNPGEAVLVPEPGYPVYGAGTIFAGGEPIHMPLKRENGFLPVLSDISPDQARRARLLWINYPNNPTAAICDLDFFAEVAAFAEKNGIIVAHDAAYTELAFDGLRPPSFLAAEGAREVGIEFHSLSKTYNMTGWRISFAVGNSELISGLAKIKSNLDSGIFQAVQVAGIAALNGPQDYLAKLLKMYRRRRDLLVGGLRGLGWDVETPQATFYVWCRVPPGQTSTGFTALLLEEAGIVTTPGVGLGPSGEGYVRWALTRPEEEIAQALERLSRLKLDWD